MERDRRHGGVAPFLAARAPRRPRERPLDPADPLYTPHNAMGGVVGVSSASPGQVQVAGMRGDYQVCSSAIPGRFAKQLDIMLDDADTASGHMRTIVDGAPMPASAVATAAVVDNDAYTVCMTF